MNLIASSANEFCVFFSFDLEKGAIQEVHRVQTDFKKDEPCQVLNKIFFLI